MKGTHLKQIGFIAQEVKPLIPEVVDGADGSLGISYGNLTALTIKAIQELNQKLNALGGLDENGRLAVKEVKADKVITKQFEVQDSATGETFCVRLVHGEWDKTPGACP